jgi:Kef-type K+ transport system membrane component KefB
MGLAPIVGAYAAGLVLEESHSEIFVQRGERPLGELIEPIAAFLVPIFFVVTGIRTDLGALAHPSSLLFAVVIALAAIAGKLACALPAGRLTVGVGMIPRGEVTLIFASMGAAVIGPRAYSALVVVVALTTLVTPSALKAAFGRQQAAGS